MASLQTIPFEIFNTIVQDLSPQDKSPIDAAVAVHPPPTFTAPSIQEIREALVDLEDGIHACTLPGYRYPRIPNGDIFKFTNSSKVPFAPSQPSRMNVLQQSMLLDEYSVIPGGTLVEWYMSQLEGYCFRRLRAAREAFVQDRMSKVTIDEIVLWQQSAWKAGFLHGYCATVVRGWRAHITAKIEKGVDAE